MDPVRVALMVLISMFASAPMFVWLILGGTGSLGEFGTTETYETIKYALIAATLIFYFIIQPFLIWPRLLNKPNKKARKDEAPDPFGD